jgi:hypothetical protein
MAAQILTADQLIPVAHPTDNSASKDESRNIELFSEDGNIFLGIFVAMLVNVILLILGVAGWELWRHIG